MAFTIPSTLQDSYNEIVDALLTSDMTSFVCKVHYPPLKDQCVNCEVGPLGNGSIYRVGGPNPFSFGVCPICQGVGYRETETSENVRLRVYITPKKYKENGLVENAIGYIIGGMNDLSKIRRAAFIEILSDNTPNHLLKFRLCSEPIPHGFGRNRYFRCDIENN